MKAFRGLLWALVICGLFYGAAGIMYAANAGADPGDPKPIGEVAVHVCERLDANPTVAEFNSIVAELFAVGNTEEQENEVMWQAMNIYCPEYKPLAYASLRDAVEDVLVKY
jgi:hypothetical protein